GWLLVATGVGIGSTLLLRCWLFAERSDRQLRRLLRAFRAHLHALVEAVGGALATTCSARGGPEEMLSRRRIRLNQTALLVADRLEPRDGAGFTPALGERGEQTLILWLLDAELAAERLAVATQRLLQGAETLSEATRRSLLGGLRCLSTASATGTPPAAVGVLLKDARRSVDDLVAETHGYGDRTQRVGLAVVRLAEAMEWVARIDGSPPGAESSASPRSACTETVTEDGAGEPLADTEPTRAGEDHEQGGLQLTTRQAIQVGVATSLAIVVGELLSPSRWYWAVIAAFVVFAGTTSRGDVLNRGLQRIVGTIGGVLAGMGLAVLVGPHHQVALILLACCVFLAMYLARVSQTLMAFWITAVLALLYGLIGQFSVHTLVLRIEETAAGAILGMLAGYLILPKRTQEAFGDALDEMVDTADSVVETSIDQVLGRGTSTGAVSLARDMGSALETLRARAEPLDNPLPRRRFRTSYQRALGVLSGVDYYARSLARVSDTVRDPGWAATLEPAVTGVRANLDGLRHLLQRRVPPQRIHSAEAAVDAAEVYAVRADCTRRAGLLTITRLLRRIDQAVVGFATDIDHVTG
ncbi:MAG: FUSC family protein, partial [Pseudonocardiaceae bacterium]